MLDEILELLDREELIEADNYLRYEVNALWGCFNDYEYNTSEEILLWKLFY